MKQGHRVVTPTSTGLGERSHLIAATVTVEVFVTDLVNVLETEELEDVVLVGHSFGGIASSGAADRVTTFARQHPLMLIAGGLAVGVVLSTLVPRSPTRKLSKKTIALMASLAEVGMAYGRDALDTVGEAAEGAGKQGKARLAELTSTAKDKAADALEQVSALVGRD